MNKTLRILDMFLFWDSISHSSISPVEWTNTSSTHIAANYFKNTVFKNKENWEIIQMNWEKFIDSFNTKKKFICSCMGQIFSVC